MPTICTRTIKDLCGMNFLIPSYQRGYRWRAIQVEQMLNDLLGFYKDKGGKPEAWYCLQPLVVAQKKGDGAVSAANSTNVLPCGHVLPSGAEAGSSWTVIDGQQRLTTLFIILSQLGQKDAWMIEYETREGSRDFLRERLTSGKDSASREESTSNPDFCCMQEAADTVFDWLNSNVPLASDRSALEQCILNNAKFICYETSESEDHYDVFIRLNSGKISLSNAELIKALLLRETRFQDKEGTVKLQQLEIAGEWDRIEQALGNDEFWYFINSDAKSPRFNATRIDFLFELVLRKGFDGQTPISNYLKEFEKNPYIGFAKFSEYCKSVSSENPEKVIWEQIQSVFRRIKSWYDNRSLYHFVGFLMNRKGENAETRIETLTGLLITAENNTRSAFEETIRNTCAATITKSKPLDELEYNKDNNKINDVLLLFNLALLARQNTEQSRYPFKTHTGTAWSLEHIHAKNERSLDDNDIAELQEAMGFDKDGTIDIEELNEQLKKSDIEIETVVDAFKTSWKVMCRDQETHGLENLALLERTQNSKFNNKLYPAKRRILSFWEKEVKDLEKINNFKELPAFIPLGTRMAFFKHFSPNNSASFVWDTSDSEAYFDTIVKMVANYVGVKEDELISQNVCAK